VTKLPAGSLGSDPQQGRFSSLYNIDSGSGAHPASCPLGTGVNTSVQMSVGREVNHNHPYKIEVKNARSYTSTPQYICMAWCWVKHATDIFTFTVYI
jgi:hypothetical protein